MSMNSSSNSAQHSALLAIGQVCRDREITIAIEFLSCVCDLVECVVVCARRSVTRLRPSCHAGMCTLSHAQGTLLCAKVAWLRSLGHVAFALVTLLLRAQALLWARPAFAHELCRVRLSFLSRPVLS